MMGSLLGRIAFVASIGLLGGFATQAHANLLINGDFEASSNSVTTPPGWTNIGHMDGVIPYSNFNTPAYNGSYFYDIGGYGSPLPAAGDGIMQTVATIVGQKYRLTFGLSSENVADNEIADVSIGGQLTQYTLGVDSRYGELAKPFSTYSILYTATSAFTDIAFTVDARSSGLGNNDPMIDGVSFNAISAVPLPASAPLFGAALLALAGFGYGMNRWVAPRVRRDAAGV